MSNNKDSAARLTAIAERNRVAQEAHWYEGGYILPDIAFLLAHVETLQQELREQSDRCDRADEAYAKAQQEQARLEAEAEQSLEEYKEVSRTSLAAIAEAEQDRDAARAELNHLKGIKE